MDFAKRDLYLLKTRAPQPVKLLKLDNQVLFIAIDFAANFRSHAGGMANAEPNHGPVAPRAVAWRTFAGRPFRRGGSGRNILHITLEVAGVLVTVFRFAGERAQDHGIESLIDARLLRRRRKPAERQFAG